MWRLSTSRAQGDSSDPPSPACSGYLNNRYYDPTLGTFLSVDPLVNKTGDPYLYANGNPTTLSDPSGLIGSSLVCGGVDGIGCVNNVTAKGFTSFTQTPVGDVISAVAHWQGAPPLDITDEWVKSRGNSVERRINFEMHDCMGGDSDGECGHLALLMARGTVAQATKGWRAVCSSKPDLCFTRGSAADDIHPLEWMKSHRGFLATTAASVWCLVPAVGWSSCAGAQALALGVRSQQRGITHFKDNGIDAAVTAASLSLGGVFAGEAAVTNEGAKSSLFVLGFDDVEVEALKGLGSLINDAPIYAACLSNEVAGRRC